MKQILLAFTTFEDETSFTAADHKANLDAILQVFDKTLGNVICLVGDNCPTNNRCADDCEIPLIGCAAHRFNLEVQTYLLQHTEILQKVYLKAQVFHIFRCMSL